jgi:hypothetical protein
MIDNVAGGNTLVERALGKGFGIFRFSGTDGLG